VRHDRLGCAIASRAELGEQQLAPDLTRDLSSPRYSRSTIPAVTSMTLEMRAGRPGA